MTLIDEIRNDVQETVKKPWTKREGKVIPELEHLTLGNDRVELEAVFLYADLADSTELAIGKREIASEVCKAYIRGVTKLIKDNDGEVRSFDGDRVMGVFFEGEKNTAAVRCGVQIATFFNEVLVPELKGFYGLGIAGFNLSQTVGIDASEVYVCRAGARNDNDLIWVGRAPNIAAKLSGVRNGYNVLITDAVYPYLLSEVLNDIHTGKNVWLSVDVPGMKGYGLGYVGGTNARWVFGT
jgi:class 3 adenylate cyclase